jgi:hypothetical protein
MRLGLNTAVTAARYRSGFGGAPATSAGGGGDTTAPGKPVLSFVASNGSDDVAINIVNTPGDNGFSGGTCAFYESRFSLAGLIITESDWTNATILDGPWTPNSVAPNALSSFYYPGLDPVDHWIAFRYKDAAGNIGAISDGMYVHLQ